MSYDKMQHLYVHFPFCRTKCDYCGFYSVATAKSGDFQSLYDKYIRALSAEFEHYAELLDLSEVKTIFVGGGSPSLVDNFISDLSCILARHIDLRRFFDHPECFEFTTECNINQVNATFITHCLNAGVNRFSVGVQSFNDEALIKFGRNSSKCNQKQLVSDKLDLFQHSLQQTKIRLSIDLINNLGLNVAEIKEEIQFVENILCQNKFLNHISVYDLTVDECSKLAKNDTFLKKLEQNSENSDLYNELLMKILQKNGFVQYEVSNFARNDEISRHNLAYWNYESYLGLGPAAHSTVGKIRLENVRNVYKYISFINDEKFEKVRTRTELTKKEQIQEYLLMKLRLLRECDALDLECESRNFDFDFRENFAKTIDRYSKIGYLKFVGDSKIIATNKGINFLNSMLIDFFEELDSVFQ